jgi:hypothetical protein
MEEYIVKKCAKKLTLDEEIYFMWAEKEERARLNRLEREEQFAAASEHQSDSEVRSPGTAGEDDLTMPMDESSRSASKRRYQETQADKGDHVIARFAILKE